jgi:hypothetical protein
VDDPRDQSDRARRNNSIARARRFCRLAEINGFALRAVNFAYKQPPLSHVQDGSPQEALLLMLAGRNPAAQMTRSQALDLLSFIYEEVYPEGYSDNAEENALYREICRERKDALVADLPENIATVRIKQFLTGGRNASA